MANHICSYEQICEDEQTFSIFTCWIYVFARKQVILVSSCSVILILPVTFDSSIKVAHTSLDTKVIHIESIRDNSLYKRIYLFGVLNIQVLLVPWVCVMYVGIRLSLLLHSLKHLSGFPHVLKFLKIGSTLKPGKKPLKLFKIKQPLKNFKFIFEI